MTIASIVHKDGYLEITDSDGNFYRIEVKWEDCVVSAIESSGQYKVVNMHYQISDGHLIVVYTDGTTQTELDIDPSGAAGISNIVEDISPQLGGDLDLNSKSIDFPTTPNISDCLDEDNMASNSATKLATQQSIKAYADTMIAKALFDANTILAANSDNTPAALAVAEQRVVGRITSGNITALTAAQILTLIGVAAGADVTGSNPPQAHKGSHEDTGADEIDVGGLAGLLVDDQHVLDAEAKAAAIAGWTASRALQVSAGGSIEVSPVTLAELNHLDGVTSGIQAQIDGKIANVVEDTTPQLGGNLELNSKNIELPIEPGADDTASGMIWKDATVDTNAEGIGAPLFMAADGHFDTADADASTTAPCVALALEADTGTKDVLLFGIMRHDAWNWTTGPGKAGLIYVNVTVGTLTQTQPTGTDDVIQPVGYALTDDVIFFCPSMMYFTHT